MPSAGQTTDEALITKIYVSVGDTVKRGDVLLETETDKAVLPVESFAAGQVLDILVSEGDTVNAGTVLLLIGESGEADTYRASQPKEEIVPEKQTVQEDSEDDYRPIMPGAKVTEAQAVKKPAPYASMPAMPNAKLMAKERGIDIAQVSASNGVFIKREDVLAYKAAPIAAEEAEYELAHISRMRQIIGKRMLESTTEIPAWQCTVAVNMEKCIALRTLFKEKKGVKLSYNDIIMRATAVAAEKFSLIRARFENGELRIYKRSNIGIAVGLDDALVVPVVAGADTMGLEGIAAASRAMIEKARAGKLGPADMGNGSITISNLGMYDVKQFAAIVNPPESAILAVGSVNVEPVWNGTCFEPIHMMNITGSFDHRFIDGAYGAQFLQELKALLEEPELMLG